MAMHVLHERPLLKMVISEAIPEILSYQSFALIIISFLIQWVRGGFLVELSLV
jgi:hypothetical protein